MAYPITNEALRLFKESYRQVVDIDFKGVRDELTISEKEVIAGGLSINRYSVSGSKIEIGSAVAAELSLVLDNADGKYNEVTFEGAELYVRVGTKKWDAKRWEKAQYYFIPFGYFTVDEAPRKLEKITLTALDRMVMFDKPVDNTKIVFPLTVASLLDRVCSICGVTLGIDATKLINADYVIDKPPTEEDLIYRQYVAWIAEITGTCAFIDWDGKLILKWYEDTDTEITLGDRYSSDLQENEITISGVQVVVDGLEYLVGNKDYAFNIESNGLIQNNPRTVAEGLFAKLYGFSYTPFTARVKPMPHLYPLDKISFVDKLGVAHPTIITDCTFTLNNGMSLEGKGETAAKNGYASINPLTARERAILSKFKNDINRDISSREQALLDINETICNSIGLRRTIVPTDGEGDVYYFHDGDTLENSNIIYTFKSGGFAWTDNWNNGEPVWQYGFTKDGNAVLNILSAYKITSDYLEAGCITAEHLSVAYKNSVTQQFSAGLGSLRSEIYTNTGLGTTLEQNAEWVRIRWNQVSKYIEFANGAINIYSSTDQTSDDLLCKMTYTGNWYYHQGSVIGRIGTNHFTDDEDFKGLVFDLEKDAKYMCWAHKENDNGDYIAQLIYYADNSKESKGLHIGCNLHARGYKIDNANLTNVKTDGYSTFTGELPVVSDIRDNGDGSISWTITRHEVRNGLIIS